MDGDTLVIGALGDYDTGNLSGSAYVFTRVAGGWTQAGKLTASDPKVDAGFGSAVAVHGDIIVVGAYEEDHDMSTRDAGAAYVFTRPASGWADMTQTARLTASDAAADDEFGTSVAVHGDTIVVGAPEEDTVARGSAYIFTKPANDWADMTETAALRGESDADRFGRSVAVYGGTVVVGAADENNKKGAAYVFTKSAATGVWDDWNGTDASNATARLTASDRAGRDFFGWSVAMDGETIVVGAPYNDGPMNSGSAYVFTKPASGWTSTSTAAKLIASDRAENDQFGYSVAVDGNTAVVGAYRDDDAGADSGSAHVFTRSSSTAPWSWSAKLTADDAAENDEFGISVAVHGDTVVVGAHKYDVGGGAEKANSGAAYVFTDSSKEGMPPLSWSTTTGWSPTTYFGRTSTQQMWGSSRARPWPTGWPVLTGVPSATRSIPFGRATLTPMGTVGPAVRQRPRPAAPAALPHRGAGGRHSARRPVAAGAPWHHRRGGDGHRQDLQCAAIRGIGYPAQPGRTRRKFLGQPTHPEAKA